MLQIKEGYMLRKFLDKWVAVYVGDTEARPPMFTMNKTGAFLWETLETAQTAESLTKALTDRYDVTEEKARHDVDAFVAALMPIGAILES